MVYVAGACCSGAATFDVRKAKGDSAWVCSWENRWISLVNEITNHWVSQEAIFYQTRRAPSGKREWLCPPILGYILAIHGLPSPFEPHAGVGRLPVHPPPGRPKGS